MVYSRKFLTHFLRALVAVQNKPDKGTGICTLLESCWPVKKIQLVDFRLRRNLRMQLFGLWPNFSGCTSYPVEGEWWTYEQAEDKHILWDETTEYGKLRHELLQFMIEEVQFMIAYIDEQLEEQEGD